MKFSIYLRRDGHLFELYRINRTTNGLYFNETYNSVIAELKGRGVKVPAGSSSTYHEDGRSWDKQGRHRTEMKKRNPPLTDFTGALTLSTAVFPLVDMSFHRPEAAVSLRPDDIVFERNGAFGTEVIISDRAIRLAELDERPNSCTFVVDKVFPVVLLEVFDLSSNIFPQMRFKRERPLVEGETVFFDHKGRI